MMLACSPIKETYNNVKDLLKLLSFNEWKFPYKFTADLSCINKLCGLGNHRSLFPCYLCLWSEKKGFEKGSRKRDINSLKSKWDK